ncbi:hypothetical protein ACP70R_037248 [Stipagrostis hirtigluma subsp. patula]
MAPPWVLLNQTVHFEASGGPSPEESAELMQSPQEAMAAMKPDPFVVDPPEKSHLSMRLEASVEFLGGIQGGTISSTDRSLVVLYAGGYLPGAAGFSIDGCYLVYDASNNSIAKIPPLEETHTVKGPSIKALGFSAAILSHGRGGEGAYVLAELVTTFDPGLPHADLYLWWSSSDSSSTASPGGEWIRSPVRVPLPPNLCGPGCSFNIDMAFGYSGSHVCWVDLLTGVLICDLFAPLGPEFRFISLPTGYSLHMPDEKRLRLRPLEFRSMGRVCGVIKFVALLGYSENYPAHQLVLKTWILSPDLKDWKVGQVIHIADLWASETFRQMELPRVRPMCPILSMKEDEIVYIFLNDLGYAMDIDEWGDAVGMNLILKAHYMVRLDMRRNKVLFSKKSSTNDLSLLVPTLLASDFSAYLQGLKHHQSVEESKQGRSYREADEELNE